LFLCFCICICIRLFHFLCYSLFHFIHFYSCYPSLSFCVSLCCFPLFLALLVYIFLHLCLSVSLFTCLFRHKFVPFVFFFPLFNLFCSVFFPSVFLYVYLPLGFFVWHVSLPAYCTLSILYMLSFFSPLFFVSSCFCVFGLTLLASFLYSLFFVLFLSSCFFIFPFYIYLFMYFFSLAHSPESNLFALPRYACWSSKIAGRFLRTVCWPRGTKYNKSMTNVEHVVFARNKLRP
jgi:hypothetical protein